MFDARRDPSRRQNFDTEQHLSSDREAPRSTATRKHEIPTDSALAKARSLTAWPGDLFASLTQ
jgi:hypothetical protein